MPWTAREQATALLARRARQRQQAEALQTRSRQATSNSGIKQQRHHADDYSGSQAGSHQLRPLPPRAPPPSRPKPSKMVPRQPSTPPPEYRKRVSRQPASPPPEYRKTRARSPGGPPSRQAPWRAHAQPMQHLQTDRKRTANAVPEAELPLSAAFPRDTPVQITVREDLACPQFLEDMYPSSIAFSFDGKKVKLVEQAEEVLCRFFEDTEKEIEYSEGAKMLDDSWEKFPEVGAALRDAVPSTRECFCIAKSRSHSSWALGVHERGRNRYYASRVALAMVLVRQGLDEGEEIDLAGVPQFEAAFNVCSEAPDAQLQKTSPPRKKARKIEPVDDCKPAKEDIGDVASSTLPRDVAFRINLPEDEEVPPTLEDMAATAIVVSTEGKKKKALYSHGESLLAHLLGDDLQDVEYFDDVDWLSFPQVGNALREFASTEECLTIAVSRSHGLWAVGVGNRSLNRRNAAKIALALSLTMQFEDEGEPVDLSEFQAFKEFVEEAYEA